MEWRPRFIEDTIEGCTAFRLRGFHGVYVLHPRYTGQLYWIKREIIE